MSRHIPAYSLTVLGLDPKILKRFKEIARKEHKTIGACLRHLIKSYVRVHEEDWIENTYESDWKDEKGMHRFGVNPEEQQ